MRPGKLNEASTGVLDPKFIPCSMSQINQAKFEISNPSRVALVYISPKKMIICSRHLIKLYCNQCYYHWTHIVD